MTQTRSAHGRHLASIAAWAALLIAAGPAAAQTKSFPDEWFFSGAERPAELKSLEGKPAKELSTEKWIGQSVSLNDQRGKVVVIDFWATWCGPCMAAIPKNVELVKHYKDQGLVFVGLHDARSGWDSAQSVVTDKSINYPVALDKKAADGSGESTKAYNLQFWPTYVLIDRAGIVRGAGLTPDNVEKAVKLLLAEAGPASGGGPAPAATLPADWFYAGTARPAAMKKLEGQPAPAVAAEQWSAAPITAETTKERVVVLHFFSPASTPSMRQLAQLDPIQREFASQGVVFLAIADRKGEWGQTRSLVESMGIAIPLARDAEPEAAGPDKPPAAGRLGATARAYGVTFVPATVIIDRAGKVRATGVRADKVKDIVSKLLAERLQSPAAAQPSSP